MNFNVSKENVLRMFEGNYRDLLQRSPTLLDRHEVEERVRTAHEALEEVLDIIDTETQSATSAFREGVLDSRRPSRGMTGPFVESSQEPRHTFATNVTGELRQDSLDD